MAETSFKSIQTSVRGRKLGLSHDGDLLLNRSDGGQEGCTRITVITSAQLLALNATPREIVPAPGQGYVNILKRMQLRKREGDAYTCAAGEDLVARYTDGSGAKCSTEIETAGFLDQTDSQVRMAFGPANSGTTEGEVVLVPNAAIVLALLSGEITDGTGALAVRVWYDIVKNVFDV